MIDDSALKTQTDYSLGQTEAAHRALVELVQLFAEYENEIRIVGGWVPDLMFPDAGHPGSIDVDVLIDHQRLKEAGYFTFARILKQNGYVEHPEKYFSFVKTILIDTIEYDIDIDLLSGFYGGTSDGKRSQHVQGVRALKVSGGNFAFSVPSRKVEIEAKRPDGAIDRASVCIIAVVPYFVMKTAALGRGKAKDVFDLYFILKHYPGGPTALASEFIPFKKKNLVIEMAKKLRDKFASVDHAGPTDVSEFLETDGDEAIGIRRDAYERMTALLDAIYPREE